MEYFIDLSYVQWCSDLAGHQNQLRLFYVIPFWTGSLPITWVGAVAQIGVAGEWNLPIPSCGDLDIHDKMDCHHWPFVRWKNCMTLLDHIPVNGLPSPVLLKHLPENIKSGRPWSKLKFSGKITLQLQMYLDNFLLSLSSVVSKGVQQEIANNILNNRWTPQTSTENQVLFPVLWAYSWICYFLPVCYRQDLGFRRIWSFSVLPVM